MVATKSSQRPEPTRGKDTRRDKRRRWTRSDRDSDVWSDLRHFDRRDRDHSPSHLSEGPRNHDRGRHRYQISTLRYFRIGNVVFFVRLGGRWVSESLQFCNLAGLGILPLPHRIA